MGWHMTNKKTTIKIKRHTKPNLTKTQQTNQTKSKPKIKKTNKTKPTKTISNTYEFHLKKFMELLLYFHETESKKNEWNSIDIRRSVIDNIVDCQTYQLL